MTTPDAAPTEMLSLAEVTIAMEDAAMDAARLEYGHGVTRSSVRKIYLIMRAMARRSALSEAAGKLPEGAQRFRTLDEWLSSGLNVKDVVRASDYDKLRAHATALQSKLSESSLAADDANLSAVAAKEETELLRKRLSAAEAARDAQQECARALADVLLSLVVLKAYKDSFGKTKYYESAQPAGWQIARDILTKVMPEEYRSAINTIKDGTWPT